MHARTIASLLSAAAIVCGLSAAEAANNYDGAWSVRVVGESGTCMSEQTLPLRVENGVVRYSGLLAPTTTGKVHDSGKLNLRISFNSSVIVASGDLRQQSGQGKWNSPDCAGRWFAEKA